MIVVPAFLKLLKTGIETELNNSAGYVRILFNIMFAAAKFIPSYRVKKMMFKKSMTSLAEDLLAVYQAEHL